MSQTSYPTSRDIGVAGLAREIISSRSMANGQGEALPAGVLVVEGDTDTEAKLPAAVDDIVSKAAGFAMFSHSYDNDDLAEGLVIPDGDDVGALVDGTILVEVEQTMTASDEVFVRITSDGGDNTQLGKVRKDIDAGRAVRLKGARLEKGAAAGELALLRVTGPLKGRGDVVVQNDVHIALTADATVQKFTVPADRHFVLTGASYHNVTGLAEDAANFFNIKVQTSADVVLANWSTETGAEGTIAADTVVDLTLAALAVRTLPPGTIIEVLYDEDGTATLPAGTLTFSGYLV